MSDACFDAVEKNRELTEKQRENLVRIVEAGEEGTYAMPLVYGPLLEAGLVEINETMKKGNTVATRATQAGIDFVINLNSSAAGNEMKVVSETIGKPIEEGFISENSETAKQLKGKPMFILESNVPMPSVSIRKKSESYPFDKMEVGQSFFVPDTADKPDAAKSLASTVSSATARYAVPKVPAETKLNRKGKSVPVMIETRKFVVRKVEENGLTGARVWRVK